MSRQRVMSMAEARASGLSGDFIFQDGETGTEILCRGTAGNNNHIDFMWKTRAEYEKVLRLLRLPSSAIVGNWRARFGFAIYETSRGKFIAPVAIHTYNHHVRTANPGYNPAGYTVRDGRGDIPFAQTHTGSWRPGEHECMWLVGTWEARGSRTGSYETDMRNAVNRARQALEKLSTTPAPTPSTCPGLYQVEIITQRDPLRVRSGPSITASILPAPHHQVDRGSIQTIVRESSGAGAGKWGQLQNGGWISLDFARKITPPPVSVIPTVDHPPQQIFWRVQVAAYRTREGADETVAALIAAGNIDAYRSNYNGWYRAQVGLYTNKEDAFARERIIAGQGFETFVKAA